MGIFCLFVPIVFHVFFVCWNKPRKSIFSTFCLLCWKGSKPPRKDHTRAVTQPMCVQKTTAQSMYISIYGWHPRRAFRNPSFLRGQCFWFFVFGLLCYHTVNNPITVVFVQMHTSVCVALFYSTKIGESLWSRGYSLSQGTWGSRILTLHLNYVAGYTGPLLFLFERTHNYSVDNKGLVPWRLRRVGRSKVPLASLV